MAFITSLRIKNFFSIKDEVTLDFKASPYNIENNPERLFEFNGEYYNKVISLYGANASGKTTVLKAVTALAKTIGNEESNNFPSSFKNKFSDIKIFSELEIGFVLDIDGNLEEFIYYLVFKSNNYENVGIEDEKLYDGSIDSNIIFNRKDKKIKNVANNIQEAVFENLSQKKSLIEEFYKFEEEKKLEKIRHFFHLIQFSSNIDFFNTNLNPTPTNISTIGNALDAERSEWLKEIVESFFLSFFQSIGQDIVQVKANFKKEDGKEKKFIGIEVFHKINLKEPLDFNFESDGTQMLMKILLDIIVAKVRKAVLIIDEFDSIIHPILTPIIINLLIENDIQIIYSTHNIYNMQFLQNDEIFLIEKDINHLTTIKAVKDHHEIKGYKNLLTLYENGYLGGLPNIKEIITKIL